MQTTIIAGGKGTRIRSISKTPKLLLTLNNKPLIDYIINHLKKNGCDNIIICTGYLGDKIKKYIDRKNYDITIKISQESKPLGTAGALHLVKYLLDDEFFVLYGDEYTTVNFRKMLKFHKQKMGDATLALHKSDHPQDSTVVKIDKNDKIVNFVEKPGNDWASYDNLTVTPLFVLKKEIINFIEEDKEVDFTKDVFPKMLKSNKRIFGYITEEYAKDIGTPDRYRQVQQYIATKNFLL